MKTAVKFSFQRWTLPTYRRLNTSTFSEGLTYGLRNTKTITTVSKLFGFRQQTTHTSAHLHIYSLQVPLVWFYSMQMVGFDGKNPTRDVKHNLVLPSQCLISPKGHSWVFHFIWTYYRKRSQEVLARLANLNWPSDCLFDSCACIRSTVLSVGLISFNFVYDKAPNECDHFPFRRALGYQCLRLLEVSCRNPESRNSLN